MDSQYVDVGAGLTGLNIVPSGAIILTGSNKPPLGSVCGLDAAINTVLTEETVAGNGLFMDPFTLLLLPVKSTTKELSVIVSLALTFIGTSFIPSSSI
jgi:hypothetical protein